MSILHTTVRLDIPVDTMAVLGLSGPADARSGDAVDVIRMNDHQFFFFIADVAGKGPSAARIARSFHNIVKQALCVHTSLPQIVAILADEVAELLTAQHGFITLVAGILDVQTREIRYINAGHPAPFLVSPNGCRPLASAQNLPLGIQPENGQETCQEIYETMAIDEVLILYTDGFTERRDDTGQFVGTDGLAAAALGCVHNHGSSALDHVAQSLARNISGCVPVGNMADDSTLLVLRPVPFSLAPSVDQSLVMLTAA